MSIDSEKLRQAQQAEFGPYFEYLSNPKKKPSSSESRTSMSYYSENRGLYIGLISPIIFVKEVRSAINLWFPAPVYPWCCTHAMSTPCQGDISLTSIRLTKCAIDFGGRRYITTSKFGAMAGKHVNGVNQTSMPSDQVTSRPPTP